jgi:uncharacterized pyridoxamine 5'-phosphate oxidase family protein
MCYHIRCPIPKDIECTPADHKNPENGESETTERRVTDMEAAERIQQFLKTAKVYYLATEDGDQPRVRPFGTAELFEGKVYIQTGKKKDVYHQIEKNPKVEICAFMNGEWLRVACELVPDDRFEAKKYMLDQNPDLRGMYAENDGNCIVLYMKNATATFSSFTKAPETLHF